MKTPLGENSYSFLLANKICLQLMGMPSSDSYYKPWVGFERKGEGSKKRREKDREKGGEDRGYGGRRGVSPFYSRFWIAFSAPKMEGDCFLVLIF